LRYEQTPDSAAPTAPRGWGSLSLNRLRQLARESPNFEAFAALVEEELARHG
jgi:hypothetical protein